MYTYVTDIPKYILKRSFKPLTKWLYTQCCSAKPLLQLYRLEEINCSRSILGNVFNVRFNQLSFKITIQAAIIQVTVAYKQAAYSLGRLHVGRLPPIVYKLVVDLRGPSNRSREQLECVLPLEPRHLKHLDVNNQIFFGKQKISSFILLHIRGLYFINRWFYFQFQLNLPVKLFNASVDQIIISILPMTDSHIHVNHTHTYEHRRYD